MAPTIESAIKLAKNYLNNMKKIYSNMRGGLGNLMFDCIHAYTIGKKLNIPVEFHLNTPFFPQWVDHSLGTQLDQWTKWKYERVFRNR